MILRVTVTEPLILKLQSNGNTSNCLKQLYLCIWTNTDFDCKIRDPYNATYSDKYYTPFACKITGQHSIQNNQIITFN